MIIMVILSILHAFLAMNSAMIVHLSVAYSVSETQNKKLKKSSPIPFFEFFYFVFQTRYIC